MIYMHLLRSNAAETWQIPRLVFVIFFRKLRHDSKIMSAWNCDVFAIISFWHSMIQILSPSAIVQHNYYGYPVITQHGYYGHLSLPPTEVCLVASWDEMPYIMKMHFGIVTWTQLQCKDSFYTYYFIILHITIPIIKTRRSWEDDLCKSSEYGNDDSWMNFFDGNMIVVYSIVDIIFVRI